MTKNYMYYTFTEKAKPYEIHTNCTHLRKFKAQHISVY